MADPKIQVSAEAPDVRLEIKVANAGKDGYTPVRGVDYWTEEDQAGIREYIDEQVAGMEPSGGADGGWYAPSISQPDADVMRVEYAPSKADMPAIAAMDVALPAGPQGEKGDTGEQGIWFSVC